MAKYIDAGKLKECLKSNWDSDDAERIVTESEIDNLPAADVAPVVHGRWKSDGEIFCSACGCNALMDEYDKYVKSDYCPVCGARMDGEKE